MLFSIIIPVYNTPNNFLLECIESLRKQTLANFECIIVDDGSQKVTADFCDSLPSLYKDLNIKIVHQRNGGQISARYHGVEKAIGEYCLFLDSDDFFSSDTINTLTNVAKSYPADMIIFNGLIYKGSIKSPQFWPHYSDHILFIDGANLQIFKRDFITTNRFNNICFKGIRTEIIKKSEKYNSASKIRTEEDFLMQLPIVDSIKSVVYTPSNLYYYRQSQLSVTHSYHKYLFEGTKYIYKEKLKYGIKWNIPNYIEISNNYFMSYVGLCILQLRGKKCGLSYAEKRKSLIRIKNDPMFRAIYVKYNNNAKSFKDKTLLWLLHHGFIRLTLLLNFVRNPFKINNHKL